MTVAQFAGKLEDLAQVADTRLTKLTLEKTGKKAIAVMVAASASSGGVRAPASQFKVKGPSQGKGYSSAAVVGWGFAVLDEAGSYNKPHGYTEAPKKAGKRQINPRNKRAAANYEARARAAARAFGYSKAILGNKATGFAAAYVNHPPQKAHPFVAQSEPVIGVIVEKALDVETIAALAKVGLG